MPETIRAILNRLLWRRRFRLCADAVALGGALFGAVLVLSGRLRISLAVAAVAAIVLMARRWNIRATALARQIEAADATLDNLLVTAAELDERPRPVRAEIRDAISNQAASRAQSISAAGVVPLAPSIAVAVMVVTGCVMLVTAGTRTAVAPITVGQGAAQTLPSGSILVRVTPPAYTRRAVETYLDPLQVTVLSGSRVRIDLRQGSGGSSPAVLREWTATRPESLELRVAAGAPARFLSVVVVPDAPPSVRIDRPGRDTAFANGTATLNVGIEGRDDLALAALALRYTKASGGGENVSFTEGEVPLTITRASEREWRATVNWPLGGLGLADGDVLVYRAVARDVNPAGAAVESDAFLVEIGRASEVASAGFALPSEERKYAISQQMVIYKTEQMLARRETNLDEWQLIGMEQRMVRAEVVFLSGGEIQDEVEEAAHSHELSEGRLQNQGRAEMLRAMNFMSRAEAQLNDGRGEAALVLERQALASLERALDRRRYFLRTLPDRSRIDATRRLTGERREARSWSRDRTVPDAPPAAQARAVIAALARGQGGAGELAAQVAGVDPASSELQKAAVAIASAADDRARREAVAAAMRILSEYVLTRLPATMVVPLP